MSTWLAQTVTFSTNASAYLVVWWVLSSAYVWSPSDLVCIKRNIVELIRSRIIGVAMLPCSTPCSQCSFDHCYDFLIFPFFVIT